MYTKAFFLYNSRFKKTGFSQRAAAPRTARSGGRTGGRAGTPFSYAFVFVVLFLLFVVGGLRALGGIPFFQV